MAKAKEKPKDTKHKATKIDRLDAPDFDDFGSFMKVITKDQDRITRLVAGEELIWISCFNVAINLALSGHPAKGLPAGAIVNFEGESDTGKTLLAFTAARENQRQYGSQSRCLVVDTERGVKLMRAEQLGIFVKKKPKNPKKPNLEDGEDDTKDPRAGTFEVVQATNISLICDKIITPFCAAARANPQYQSILIIDSVSMLVSTHESTTDFDTRDMARAQELRKMMRLLNSEFSKNLTVFLVHHQTDRIAKTGQVLSSKTGNHDKDIGGGKAMKFVPSVRLEVSYGGKEYRGGESNKRIIGQTCRIEVIKTRLNRPMLKAEVVIDHQRGFTQLSGLYNQLEQEGIVIDADTQGWKLCPPLFGTKKWKMDALEQELEKEENAAKVVQLITERMTMGAFVDGKQPDDEDADDEGNENPENLFDMSGMADLANKAAGDAPAEAPVINDLSSSAPPVGPSV